MSIGRSAKLSQRNNGSKWFVDKNLSFRFVVAFNVCMYHRKAAINLLCGSTRYVQLCVIGAMRFFFFFLCFMFMWWFYCFNKKFNTSPVVIFSSLRVSSMYEHVRVVSNIPFIFMQCTMHICLICLKFAIRDVKLSRCFTQMSTLLTKAFTLP